MRIIFYFLNFFLFKKIPTLYDTSQKPNSKCQKLNQNDQNTNWVFSVKIQGTKTLLAMTHSD